MYKLSLAHIYPNLLNFYSDNGNVETLKKRCEWRNIDLSVTEIHVGDKISPDFDMYFLGGALPALQSVAQKELLTQQQSLLKASDKGAVILAISEGFQLLGEYYQYKNQEKTNGLNLLDVFSIENNNKFIGNITAKCDFLSPKEIVGFENHSMETILKNNSDALFEVVSKEIKEKRFEGARKNNVFGTYLHGPFLPKNPHFADYLISLALEKKYSKKIDLIPLNDEIELNTYKRLVGKKY